jgi:hypothetical protein
MLDGDFSITNSYLHNPTYGKMKIAGQARNSAEKIRKELKMLKI